MKGKTLLPSTYCSLHEITKRKNTETIRGLFLSRTTIVTHSFGKTQVAIRMAINGITLSNKFVKRTSTTFIGQKIGRKAPRIKNTFTKNRRLHQNRKERKNQCQNLRVQWLIQAKNTLIMIAKLEHPP